ncbi:hypothetical protein PHMEG_00016838, partial [Phytophthora megakarya]
MAPISRITMRHLELPSLLVAFMESVSASKSMSNQAAEKIQTAVANHYGSYERRDAAGPDKWIVFTNCQGNKYRLGNPTKDAFVRQLCGVSKKEKYRIYTTISNSYFIGYSPSTPLSLGNISITFATYKLEGRKTEVAEGRCYNLHSLDPHETSVDGFSHLSAWLTYVDMKPDHKWSDTDYVLPALSQNSKWGLQKTDLISTGCENARVKWGKKMSEQAFITLLNCAVRDLNRNGSSTSGYVHQEWRHIWFTSHTFRRAGAQYRFMLAMPERRWSMRMVKWWTGWTQNESAETLVRYLLDQAVTDEDKQLAD